MLIRFLLCAVFSFFALTSTSLADPDSVNWENINLNYKAPKAPVEDKQDDTTDNLVSMPSFEYRPDSFLDARIDFEYLLTEQNGLSHHKDMVSSTATSSHLNAINQDTIFIDNQINAFQYDFGRSFNATRGGALTPIEQRAFATNPNSSAFTIDHVPTGLHFVTPDNPFTDNGLRYNSPMLFDGNNNLIRTSNPLFNEFVPQSGAFGNPGGELFPPGGSSGISPISGFGTQPPGATTGTPDSFYVNDTWQLNDKWSFNTGTRFDDPSGAPTTGGNQIGGFGTPFPPSLTGSPFGTPGLPGETNGIHGPMIGCGRVNNECTLVVYDASGATVGSVTADELSADPYRTTNLLNLAETRSRDYFGDDVFGDSNIDPIFADGFESGDTSAWTDSAGSGSTTPRGNTSTENNVSPDAIFADGFESGDTSAWSDSPSGGSTAPSNNNSSNDTNSAPAPTPTAPDNAAEIASLKDQIKGMKKGLDAAPAGGDSLANAMYDTLKDSLANAEARLTELQGQNNTTPTPSETNLSSQPAPPLAYEGPFSPTTRLDGESVYGFPNASAGSPSSRSQLNFDTSFTGTDRLQQHIPSGYAPGNDASFGQFQRGSTLEPFNPFANNNTFTDSASQYPPVSDTFNPSAMAVTRLGNSPGDTAHLAGILNSTLSCRSSGYGPNCFDVLVKCEVYIYVTEDGKVYIVADKDRKATDKTPNDPYYFTEVKKKKKLLGIIGSNKKPKISIGSNMKIGKSVLGAGSSISKKKSNIKDQWGIRDVGFLPTTDPNSAWNLVDSEKRNVTIAMIDSGLDMEHPDGPKYIWKNEGEIPGNGIDDDNNGYIDDVNGWNFLDNNNDLTDYRGHGTFTTGIVAAKRNNGIGIAGINPGAVIMPLKVTDDEGLSNSINIFRAVKYAVDNGAKIINISIAGKELSKILQLAFNYAHRKNVLVVVASGNEGESLEDYGPGGAQHVMAIGAVDYGGTHSVISSWGPNNALLAPGEEIFSLASKDAKKILPSLRKAGIYSQSGTSYSAPMVAATASLLLTKYPHLTSGQLEDIIVSTSVDMGEEGWDDKNGAGLLNAAAALQFNQDEILHVKFNKIKINKNEKGKLLNVDVFATVQGNIEEFSVEAGKKKIAKKFKTVAGPFKVHADNSWVARIDAKDLKGNKNWTIRLNALHKDGTTKTAKSIITLN